MVAILPLLPRRGLVLRELESRNYLVTGVVTGRRQCGARRDRPRVIHDVRCEFGRSGVRCQISRVYDRIAAELPPQFGRVTIPTGALYERSLAIR